MPDLRKLKLLIVEDSEDDALLIVRELKRGGYESAPERVETEKEMRDALEGREWDVIISDYKMPGFSGLAALEIYRKTGLDIPFIIVSGTIGEEIAAEAMVLGAHDYLMKGNLTRLVPAVQRELREALLRKARRRAAKELILTELRLKALLKLYQMADDPLERIIGFVVEECQKICESELAFVGFIDENQGVMHTHMWSCLAMEQCAVDGKPAEFPIQKAGLWGEAIRQKKTVIVNDYANPNPYKKGLPEGHVPLTRFMGVPLTDGGRVVLVAGFANKKEPYVESDTTHISLLLEGMWNCIQRRNAESELKRSLAFQQQLIDSLPLPVFYKGTEGRYLGCNKAFEKFFGKKREEIIGKTTHDISPKHIADIYRQKDLEMFKDQGIQVYEFVVEDAAGNLHNVIFNKALFHMIDGSIGGLIGTIIDITPLKKAQADIDNTMEKLRNSEKTLSAAINATNESLVLIDREGTVLLSNAVAAEKLGKSVPELLGTCLYDSFSEEVARTRKAQYDKVFETGESVYFEDVRIGRHFEHYVYPVLDEKNEVLRLAIFAREITERKKAENALRESEEKYRSLIDYSNDAILLTRPDGSILEANRAASEMFGRSLDEIINVGRNGLVDTADPRFHTALNERARTGTTVAEFTMLRANGDKFPAEVSSAIFTDISGQQKTSMIIRDVTYRKMAEEKLEASAKKLRKSLAGTIQVISMMLETRDPYTGGHQRRVSSLSRAIAQDMGLSSEAVDSIRMAGSVHDIGKMSVPAEILSKPTRLSDIEMSILKVHPQTGYDILKVVELPPPIAEIVLQHHERLDGSGYPQGLRGGEILLEAQIMAVADVVEAMASHRPYRPAIGIDTALEEIEKNKGTLYHTETVDICIRLFREKGFKFE